VCPGTRAPYNIDPDPAASKPTICNTPGHSEGHVHSRLGRLTIRCWKRRRGWDVRIPKTTAVVGVYRNARVDVDGGITDRARLGDAAAEVRCTNRLLVVAADAVVDARNDTAVRATQRIF